jgi:hypothetical protein
MKKENQQSDLKMSNFDEIVMVKVSQEKMCEEDWK